MKIYLITEKEFDELVQKIELLTLQAKDHHHEEWHPMDQLRRSIHYHVVGWVQEMKKEGP